MASKNEKYINLYRRFESVLKKSGFMTVKDYEVSLENNHSKQEQVRICRLVRNYIEHESSTFVEASDNMIDFIEKEIVAFDESETPVKKKMISVKYAIRDTDLLVVAADFMTKRKQSIIPIFNKDDFAIGTLSYEDIVRLLAAGDFTKARKVSVAQSAHKFGFLKEGSPMNKVQPLLVDHDKVYLVLNDTKKVIGWIV